MDSLGIYIHLPFCAHKCPYCDFNAYSGMGSMVDRYTEALCDEIAKSTFRGRVVTSIFFGGGTPTYLDADQLSRILYSVRKNFDVAESAEISSEANPTSVDAAKFASMRAAGFNRISIGVQAFNDQLLEVLEREHSRDEAIRSFYAARSAGFDNISIDLMFCLPTQTMKDWRETLAVAGELEPDHISTYSLTIEPGTRFERLYAGGKLQLPDDNIELGMYEYAIEELHKAGLKHYEVSNFARPGYEARHNLIYWNNGEYLGFGAGAVSFLGGTRWTNEKHPERYIQWVENGKGLVIEQETLGTIDSLAETLTQGLRLRRGVQVAKLSERFGVDAGRQFESKFQSLEEKELIEFENGSVRLTHKGLLLANDVFVDLLPD